MPELPEVETVKRGLAAHVLGRTVEHSVVRQARLRWPVPDLTPAHGRKIVSVTRRAKYLLIDLDDGQRLLSHLGMSGRWRLLALDEPLVKHDHIDLQLSGGLLMRYHDPRRFGALVWGDDLLQHLGPEPLDAAFTAESLHQRAQGKSAPVKGFIMDQSVVVGVGNIYAAESLFRARIHPLTPAGKVSLAAYQALVVAIKAVIAAAIEQGGTTLKDFIGTEGNTGYFQQKLQVYGREGQPCGVCGNILQGVRLGNRASCYCAVCQPLWDKDLI
jgi:formamidopyrimidine-DNA glycosylase